METQYYIVSVSAKTKNKFAFEVFEGVLKEITQQFTNLRKSYFSIPYKVTKTSAKKIEQTILRQAVDSLGEL